MTSAGNATPDDNAVPVTLELSGVMLDALNALADVGEADIACRLAGRACAVFRRNGEASLLHRFNVALHRLARRSSPVGTLQLLQHEPPEVTMSEADLGAQR